MPGMRRGADDIMGLVVKEALPYGEFVHGGRAYDYHMPWEQRMRPRYRSRVAVDEAGGFYVPQHHDRQRADGASWYIPHMEFLLIAAHENAEFYRWAVTDESLPDDYFCEGHGIGGRIAFGRLHFIDYLGQIGYKKALPDMREAMLHDRNAEIRESCLGALGRLGGAAYWADVAELLRKDSSVAVRLEAAKTLGRFRNPEALVPMREFFEQLRAQADMVQIEKGFDAIAYDQVSRVLQAMLAIGGELARDTVAEAFRDSNYMVHQAARTAFQRAAMDG